MPLWGCWMHMILSLSTRAPWEPRLADTSRVVLLGHQTDDTRFIVWSETAPTPEGTGTKLRVEAIPLDGRPGWSHALPGTASAVRLRDGLLINLAHSDQRALGVVDARGIRWTPPGSDVASGRTIVGDDFVLVSGDAPWHAQHVLQRWDLAPDGAPRAAWSIDTEVVTAPVVAGDKVFYETRGHVLQVAAAATGEPLWDMHIGESFRLERAADGSVVVASDHRRRRVDPNAEPAPARYVHLSVSLRHTTDPWTREVMVDGERVATDDDGRLELDLVGRGTIGISNACGAPSLVDLDVGPQARRVEVDATPCQGFE